MLFWDPTNLEDRGPLARYVLEELQEIAQVCKKAEDNLRRLPPNYDPSFDAYVSGDAGRVRQQVQAIFECLQRVSPKLGGAFTYRVEDPASRLPRQRVRLAREILELGHSECLG